MHHRTEEETEIHGHAPELTTCSFLSHSAVVLEKVVEYFHYWYRYRDKEDVPDMDIPVELCLELLMAAEFFAIDSRPDTMSHLV